MSAIAVATVCPVCACPDTTERWKIAGFTVMRCPQCTVMYVGERLTEQELGRYYQGIVDTAYTEENVRCLKYYYDNLAKRIAEYAKTPGRVFDVGCSRGWFFESMPGWECHGNEINPADAREAARRGRVFEGSFHACPVEAGYFDAVTFQDVFDHLPDPHESLRKAYSMLRPGGLLVVKVHDFGCLYAKLSGETFYALIPPFHLFYYNRRSLEHVLAANGFVAHKFRHMAHLLQVKMVFERLARGDHASSLYRLSRVLESTPVGRLSFRKNLHDIVTVFAVKR